MIDHLFQVGSVGLLYDGVGVAILGFAFFSKSIKEMMVESGTYWGGNDALLQSLVHTRTDGITGTAFLLIGFLLQWLGSFGIRWEFLGEALLIVLVVASLSYVLLFRKQLISLQMSRGVALRQQHLNEK